MWVSNMWVSFMYLEKLALATDKWFRFTITSLLAELYISIHHQMLNMINSLNFPSSYTVATKKIIAPILYRDYNQNKQQ